MSSGRPRLLDLFCCAGGATRGFQLAGFHVTGVDLTAHRRYIGDAFVQGDAIAYVREQGHRFDAIAASPPCQAYSLAQRIRNREHPDLIGPTREALRAVGRPWVIENVEGAPLLNPITLCGAMFDGLAVYRHRLFEASFPLDTPEHPPHHAPLRKMGRAPRPGEFMHVVGNFSGAAHARAAMGIDWMTRDQLREAIPPAYTEFVGEQLLAALVDQERRS